MKTDIAPPLFFLPKPALAPYVGYYLIAVSDGEEAHQVVPDTGLVMGFQLQGRLYKKNGTDWMPLSTEGITGLQDRVNSFASTRPTTSLLLYFKVGGAAAFFPQPLQELFGESIALDQLLLHSQLEALKAQLAEAAQNPERIRCIERFLMSRLKPIKPDPLVMAALALLHKTNGSIRIEAITRQLHTSQSPLEKRFRQAIGCTPKKFASLLQFKWSLQHYRHAKSLGDLGHSAGYFDQAHFIKTFKQFTGKSPLDYFGGKK